MRAPRENASTTQAQPALLRCPRHNPITQPRPLACSSCESFSCADTKSSTELIFFSAALRVTTPPPAYCSKQGGTRFRWWRGEWDVHAAPPPAA